MTGNKNSESGGSASIKHATYSYPKRKKEKPISERREKYHAIFYDPIKNPNAHGQKHIHFSCTTLQRPFIYPVPSPHIPKPCANKLLAASTVSRSKM